MRAPSCAALAAPFHWKSRYPNSTNPNVSRKNSTITIVNSIVVVPAPGQQDKAGEDDASGD